LTAGNGQDVLIAGTGAHQLLIGGSSNDVFTSAASSDTMEGGGGNDLFNLSGHHVSDSIDGGAGNDTVAFDSYSSGDLAHPLTTHHGETVIQFKDGQTVTVTHVENVQFTDKTEHLP
jgi:Ca2+-binding RTX toxin-like protein